MFWEFLEEGEKASLVNFLKDEPVLLEMFEVEKLEDIFFPVELLLLEGLGEEGDGRFGCESEDWSGSTESESCVETKGRLAFGLFRTDVKRRIPLGERGGSGVVEREVPTRDETAEDEDALRDPTLEPLRKPEKPCGERTGEVRGASASRYLSRIPREKRVASRPPLRENPPISFMSSTSHSESDISSFSSNTISVESGAGETSETGSRLLSEED